MARGASIVLLSLLLSAPAAAQSTRAGTIAEQQVEKARKLGTEGPSEAELVVRRVLISPLLNGGDGVYPWFGSVFGGGDDLRYNVTRGGVAIDWRTAPGYSTRGGFYRATWERHNETNSHPHSFDLQEFEIVQLVPLVREQFVLAARGLVTLTSTEPGSSVPVMLSPYLGSGSTLRGFSTRRFTDRNRVLLTGEYRWRPSRDLDLAVFMDAGQVAADRTQFHARDFETNWGLGARFHGPTFTALRVEVVRGREGMGLIIAGGQIF